MNAELSETELVSIYEGLIISLGESVDRSDTELADIYTKLIDTFCKFVNRNGYIQGTSEWVRVKKSKFYFGGTAMGYFTGAPYKNIFDLVAEKSEVKTNPSELHIMAFGSMFEELVKRVSEHDCKMKVYGENIYVIATELDALKPQGLTAQPIAYSPDGIALIDTAVQGGPNIGIIPCLTEYKCPWSRNITGKVPLEYTAQQRMGMDVISRFAPIKLDLKWSLYLEAAFRPCRLDELAFNAKYDPTFNVFKDKPPVPFTNAPVAIGIIGFISENPNFTLHGDFGKLPHEGLRDVICAYARGEIHPVYYDLVWNGDSPQYKQTLKEQLSSIILTDNHVGFLPYKLFRRDYHWFERVENFLDPYLPKMMEMAEIIQEIRTRPQESRLNILNQLL